MSRENCKDIPSATPSAAPKYLSTHQRISVNKMCYRLARFRLQKAPVNRKYGHDTQGVAGSSPARPTSPWLEAVTSVHFQSITRLERPLSAVVSATRKRGIVSGSRGNDEGSIYQRTSDRRWLGVVTIGRDSNGRVVRKTVSAKTEVDPGNWTVS